MTAQSRAKRIPKPFTTRESTARSTAAVYLGLAQSYRTNGDILNAVACCLEGQAHITGISRPLVVRDQIDDLLRLIDPNGATAASIRNCIRCGTRCLISAAPGIHPITSRHQHLERFVSAHQLLEYPSEYAGFNEAYEQALSCLRGALVNELYVIQYDTNADTGRNKDDLRFSFVPGALISEQGPFFLTSICAAVRLSQL